MLRKVLVLFLVASLIGFLPGVQAKSRAEKRAEFSQKVKTGIEKLGTGDEAHVWVKLRDKTKVQGFIKEAGPESFVVADPKTGSDTTIPYSSVAQVKGNNLSRGAKIAIGVGIAAAVIAIIVLIVVNNQDFNFFR